MLRRTVALALAAPLAAVALAGRTVSASTGPASAGTPAVATLGTAGALFDVAAISGNSAWAVGHQGKAGQPERTLLAHWTGKKWGAVTSPKPVNGALQAIKAVSPTSIWAVGGAGKGTAMTLDSAPAAYRPLIWHWNGKKWAATAGLPKVTGWLDNVTVVGQDVWAVGETAGPAGSASSKNSGAPLILRLAGGHWSVVRSGAPAAGALWGIAAAGAKSIWAIGAGAASWSTGLKADLLHWNGTRWAPVSSPLGGVKAGDLEGIAAGPGGTTLAVGSQGAKVAGLALVWNGKAWQGAPTPVTSGYLNNVAKIPGSKVPGGSAWAVGATSSGGIIALRWTGTSWASAPTPARPGYYVELTSVSASTPANAWAVGAQERLAGGPASPIILHWNGQHWS